MKLLSSMGWLSGIAVAGALVYAKYRSDETGKDMITVLQNLPEELKETQEELQGRLKRAIEAGRQAAGEREADIDKQLSVSDKSHSSRESQFPEFIV